MLCNTGNRMDEFLSEGPQVINVLFVPSRDNKPTLSV